MLNQSLLLRALATSFALIFLLSCATTATAQSGRRVRKTTPTPESTPEPTPEPTPNTASAKSKPRLTFVLGLDRYDGFANIPLYAYEGVLQTMAERLSRAPGVEVGATRSDMDRSDAIRKAKAEKDGYVVFVQLRVDTMGGSNNGTLDNVTIEYTVLAPTTAKVSTTGRTYPQRNRGIINLPGTSPVYGDRYLNQAAQDAADRILAYFRLHGPPIKLP